ncbi:MAG: protein-glutamate O-methyltransferase CheR, partial [bacterium]|nr:protein-glutamate O-methyltransferase CheR [bacterium]
MSTIGISENEFQSLRDLIRERFGIFYDDTKQFLLQSRLQTRLLKCRVADFSAYYRFLTTSPDRETEWAELASVLSNNETYFFRERAQLRLLSESVLAEFQKRSPRVRIWSAACSSGEEPYSLAMTLLETGRIAEPMLAISATDISPRVL